MEKRGFGEKKKKASAAALPKFFLVSLSKVNSTFHDISLPLSSQTHLVYNIQN